MSLIRHASSAAVVLSIALAFSLFGQPVAQAQVGKDSARDARRPKDFAIIFNYGYAGDNFPQDKAS